MHKLSRSFSHYSCFHLSTHNAYAHYHIYINIHVYLQSCPCLRFEISRVSTISHPKLVYSLIIIITVRCLTICCNNVWQYVHSIVLIIASRRINTHNTYLPYISQKERHIIITKTFSDNLQQNEAPFRKKKLFFLFLGKYHLLSFGEVV